MSRAGKLKANRFRGKTMLILRKVLFVTVAILFLVLLGTFNKSEAKPKCQALTDFCPTCDYNEMIDLISEWNYPSSLNSYLEQIEPIRDEVESILEKHNISKYWIYLALAESGGITNNVSSKQAKGLWQLMPYISRHYGLVINSKVDERNDYRKATEAAAQYIKRNVDAFNGNALWGIAAYNAGGSNLKRKTNYRYNDSIKKVRSKSYQSYALAITVIKMIYVAECKD
jgi:hypothetical protein